MSGFLNEVNQTQVSVDLLREVVQMHAAMPAEDRPIFEARAFKIFELLNEKGVPTREIAPLATAIDFRLTALARLHRDAALKGWTMPGLEPGAVSISAELLRVAADEPLIENDEEQAAFDVESFRRRVLAGAEAVGRS